MLEERKYLFCRLLVHFVESWYNDCAALLPR